MDILACIFYVTSIYITTACLVLANKISDLNCIFSDELVYGICIIVLYKMFKSWKTHKLIF